MRIQLFWDDKMIRIITKITIRVLYMPKYLTMTGVYAYKSGRFLDVCWK